MSYLNKFKKNVGKTTGTIKNSTKSQWNKLKKSPGKVLLDPQHGTRAATEMTEKMVTGDTKLTHQFGKAFGGKSAEDRLGGAVKGGMTAGAASGWNPYAVLGGAVLGGATGAEAIQKGLTGQPVKGETGGPTGKGAGVTDPAAGILGGEAPDAFKNQLDFGALSQFQGYTPSADLAKTLSGIRVDPEALKAKAVADMQSPNPIVAAKAAKVLGIDPNTLPQVQAETVGLGDKSEFLQGQRDIIAQLQGRVAGTAGPSLAELQLYKAQQDMINQMAAQAGSMSGRAMPAAQRQLLQTQAQSGQQLAMDAAILRAQEQQQAEAQLAGALGQYRGQDLQRTGLQLDADTANQVAKLKAQGMNQETALAVALGNLKSETDIALGNLDAETKALIANQNVDFRTKLANLEKNTKLSTSELEAAVQAVLKNTQLDFDTQTYIEDQILKGKRLEEEARKTDIQSQIDEEKIKAMDRKTISDAVTAIKTAEIKGDQNIAGIREQKKMDIGGELLKGGANWFAEWYGSGGGDGTEDDFLADAIEQGY